MPLFLPESIRVAANQMQVIPAGGRMETDIANVTKAIMVSPAGLNGAVPFILAIFVLTLLMFTGRKLASMWSEWNGAASALAKLFIFGGGIAAGLWAVSAYDKVARLGEGPVSAMAVVSAGLAWWVAKKMGLTFIKPADKVTKGAVEATPEEVAKLVKKDGPARMVLAGVPLPRKAEATHFMMVGGTGSGKSVAIGQLLERLYADGDTAILVDSGGDFASKYYDAKRDFILNPFDERTVSWNPMAEMAGPYDAEALAKSIIPEGTGDSKEWNSYAQIFLSSCLTVLKARQGTTINDLMFLAQQASIDELRGHLRGTAAYSQLESDKMFGSIRVIVNTYLTVYSYLRADSKSAPFSVKGFIEASKPGVLFVTYKDDQLDTLRNLVACVLDIAARSTLSLNPDPNRRIWLIIDEFSSIGKVQSVEAFAAKARKCGGCLVIGLQTVSQLKDRYGEHQAQSLLGNLGTWLMLRCMDGETAEYMSKYIGDQTVVSWKDNQSESNGGGSRGHSEQETTRRAVMPSELQELPPLKGFLRVAGGYPVCRIELEINKKRQASKPSFIAKDFSAPVAAPVTEPVQEVLALPAAVQSGTVASSLPEGPIVVPPTAPVLGKEAEQEVLQEAVDEYLKELLASLEAEGR